MFHLEVKACIPVDDAQDVEDELQNAEQVGVVCLCVRPVKKLHHTEHLDETVKSDVGFVQPHTWYEVQQVSGKNGHKIQSEP